MRRDRGDSEGLVGCCENYRIMLVDEGVVAEGRSGTYKTLCHVEMVLFGVEISKFNGLWFELD